MATKEQVGKVKTPACLTNIETVLKRQSLADYKLGTYAQENGERDIINTMAECVWWFEQVTGFRSWPTFAEELEQNPHLT